MILVGEIRDQETLTIVLEAAQRDHLVLGSLLTNSAVKTVERVLGMFPTEEQECAAFNVGISAGGDRPGANSHH